MRLNLTFVDGKPIVTDDRGDEMPCIRAVATTSHHKDVSEITITLVVDNVNVTLGAREAVGEDQ